MAYGKSEKALRKMRQQIFNYDGTPREAQAARVLEYLKKRKLRQPQYRNPPDRFKHWMYACE
ncbi:MAG: hypothetical protein FPO08_00375 [Geobacter sp.]|nr:MAG: hypothetical protein FPO08_00375 [Geobacter sp.]